MQNTQNVRLYDIMMCQKAGILTLIADGKINEARSSLEVVKQFWGELAMYNHYEELQKDIERSHAQSIRDARKSFEEEIRVTGR